MTTRQVINEMVEGRRAILDIVNGYREHDQYVDIDPHVAAAAFFARYELAPALRDRIVDLWVTGFVLEAFS